VVAIERAQLSFPFKRWFLVAEGGSTVHLARLSGRRNAARLLDGWIPGAVEAQTIGLIEHSVSEAPATLNFLKRAQTLAEHWV